MLVLDLGKIVYPILTQIWQNGLIFQKRFGRARKYFYFCAPNNGTKL